MSRIKLCDPPHGQLSLELLKNYSIYVITKVSRLIQYQNENVTRNCREDSNVA